MEYILKRLENQTVLHFNDIINERVINNMLSYPIVIELLNNHQLMGEFLAGPIWRKEVDQSNCAIAIDRLFIDGEELKADIIVLDTPMGRILNNFIDKGTKFKYSIRGSEVKDINGNIINISLAAIDISLAL